MPAILPPGDPLLQRFSAAASKIAWRPAAPGPASADARIAHLHDEEARVEWRRTVEGTDELIVDAGPLGALVLLLETSNSASMPSLRAIPAGDDPAFPGGGLAARWGPGRPPSDALPVGDLVSLARYALA